MRRLAATEFRERRIGLALQSAQRVPFAFAVTNE
jgi:hypothetical protein